jgi:hypothetical protein
LKARLQYAQIKLETGLSTEKLQQIEHAFLYSPRQPRRPLPSEYPPIPATSSPHSRKLKRLLLSAVTSTQNSWRKKKKIREQKKNEAIQDEAAARTIMMLSSSQETQQEQYQQLHTPPRTKSPSSGSSGSPPEGCRIKNRSTYNMNPYSPSADYYGNLNDEASDIDEAVANAPNSEKKNRYIGQSFPRRSHSNPHQTLPPPAIVSDHNSSTGSPHYYYQYNRPLPPPPQYYYKPRSPLIYDGPLLEDPFCSAPIFQSALSDSHHRSSPSLSSSKK